MLSMLSYRCKYCTFSEADPTTGWSKPMTNNSDIRYAITLVDIVFQYWNMKFGNILENIESISHDNAFLSYHPHEFSQRTLLARFEFNLTAPRQVQFVEKPVYAALGMLSYLGDFAGSAFKNQSTNITYVASADMKDISFYICAIVFQSRTPQNSETPERRRIILQLPEQLNGFEAHYESNVTYIVEYLEENRTDPAFVWRQYGNPAYPNATARDAMRRVQVNV